MKIVATFKTQHSIRVPMNMEDLILKAINEAIIGSEETVNILSENNKWIANPRLSPEIHRAVNNAQQKLRLGTTISLIHQVYDDGTIRTTT